MKSDIPKSIKVLTITFGSLTLLACLVFFIAWVIGFHPSKIQAEPVQCKASAPTLDSEKPIKIMSWNIQFMAGKNYVFFYDLFDGSGPDERPTRNDIEITLREISRIIMAEDPDILLLQEVDDGAKKTDYEDQLTRLLGIVDKYSCYTSAFYWKSTFVPHPRIWGAVGTKLVILSKFKIDSAIRYQLPYLTADPFSRQFQFKRAILEAKIPTSNGKSISIMDTHLDAFAQGDDVMKKQIEYIDKLLQKMLSNGQQFIIGGDFNLLPPGAYSSLATDQQKYYSNPTEITPLFSKYTVVPPKKHLNCKEHKMWFTHFPNDPSVKQPDRTIDFFFLPKELTLTDQYVRHHDTQKISDHFPLIVNVKFQ